MLDQHLLPLELRKLAEALAIDLHKPVFSLVVELVATVLLKGSAVFWRMIHQPLAASSEAFDGRDHVLIAKFATDLESIKNVMLAMRHHIKRHR